MEDEIKKCRTVIRWYATLNVILFTNRIIVEFDIRNENDEFCVVHPHNIVVHKQKMPIKDVRNVSISCGNQYYVEYLSEQYDDFPTYHAIYQVEESTRESVMVKIAAYYQSIDPQNKMVSSGDHDILFAYN